MDLKSLIAKLHPLERAVIPILKIETELAAIMKATGLQEVEVMRALQWLENKEILKIHSQSKRVILLDENGVKYKRKGLPEKKFLAVLTDSFISLSEIAKKAKLDTEELNACIGLLKRKNTIDIKKEKELMVKRGPLGSKILKEGTLEEKFLTKQFPIDAETIIDVDKLALEELQRRKGFVRIEEQKKVTIELLPLGKQLLKEKIEQDVVNRLTKEMLKTGSWKQKKFRAYDVEINVPKKYPGRKHFDNEALAYIKRIWLDMGFQEMTGNYVQSAFWDLDALFVPQDHPAREMQDTFYVEGKAKLPKIWEKIKEVHENGGDTGSTGWGYKFSKEETEQLLLRTHTTVLSAQTLTTLKKEDLPAKFFAVGKVFRNEALDWKHLFEFYQVDGIVVDPNANLKNLKGYLTQFYKKMGYPKVRMRPAHFPYTEPSAEVEVLHPIKKQWIELGGAGIFRPEVTKPLLGFECPVAAWGIGIDRSLMDQCAIKDIRELHKNDLKQLREFKMFLK